MRVADSGEEVYVAAQHLYQKNSDTPVSPAVQGLRIFYLVFTQNYDYTATLLHNTHNTHINTLIKNDTVEKSSFLYKGGFQ